MGELSRRSGVPPSTIKYYMREGLLPGAAVAQTRNSALYDPSLAERLKDIKAMQQEHFLPLWRIKELVRGPADPRVATVAAAVDRALKRPSTRPIRRADAVTRGMSSAELRALTELGLLSSADPLVGDDAAIVQTILAARRAGVTAHMDLVAVVEHYARAVRRLVQAELAVFAQDILPRGGSSLGTLTEDAMGLAERLVIHLRRRALFPEFERLVADARAVDGDAAPTRPRGRRTASRRTRP